MKKLRFKVSQNTYLKKLLLEFTKKERSMGFQSSEKT